MLCSILISNFNKSKYLERCLQSVINQTFKNIEIIFSDNGSTDASIKIASNYENIEILSNERGTSFPALNQIEVILKAFEKSKGEYIFFLDSDDFFEKNKVEEIIKHKLKNNFQFIADKPKLYINENNSENFKDKNLFKTLRSWPIIFPTSSLSCTREFFKNFKNYLFFKDYDKLEIDTRLNIFSNIENKREIYDKKILTNYRQTNEGIMSNYKKFSNNWWNKRFQAHKYLHQVQKIKKIKTSKNLDYFVTSILKNF